MGRGEGIDPHTHRFAVGGVTVALSVRTIARECLNIAEVISVREDILTLRTVPPPRSLRKELNFIRRTRCPLEKPTNMRVTEVADRKISVSWNDQSDNEDGFRIQFRGKRTGSTDHTGSKSVGRNEESASLAGLRSGHEYTISVVAFNAGRQSESSNEARATTPARTITVSTEGAGPSTVFAVTGAGFTPGSLVVVRFTDPQLHQVQGQATAGGDGRFNLRHSVPCGSSTQVTVTAFEDADPLGTFANAVVTTCP